MKVAICISIICLTTAVGMGFSRYYVEREKFFCCLNNFLKELLSALNFSKTPINKLLKDCEVVIEDLLSTPNNILKINFLKPSEKKKIHLFFASIGSRDSLSDVSYTQEFLNFCLEIEKKAILDREKRAPFCIKLGFLIGLFIIILVV